MNVIVFGSRSFTDRFLLRERLRHLRDTAPCRPGEINVAHGKCPQGGADIIAGEEAEDLGMRVLEFPPENYGKWPACGPIRNRDMHRQMQPLWGALGFLNFGEPVKGSADMTNLCMRAGTYVELIYSGVLVPNPRWR